MPAVSFCSTCRNRLWQLRQTLPVNLSTLRRQTGTELILVDYGSSDGLAEWVWQNFQGEIDAGLLQFFQLEGRPPWNCARAKNLAHRLATGSYLFNLDADNFIQQHDLEQINPAAVAGKVIHQWSGDWHDGSPGRIGLPRELFYTLGGYDEGMLGVGMHDIDLLHRCERIAQLPLKIPAPSRQAIANSVDDKIAQVDRNGGDPHQLYQQMLAHNRARAKLRLQLHGETIVDGFATAVGRLNGRRVEVSGTVRRLD